jgi:glutaredoxin-like YruB-family protein
MIKRALLLITPLMLMLTLSTVELYSQQSKIASNKGKSGYPKIVLYSVSWCPHCKAAKEYFTRKNIPFINKDVQLDSNAMEEVTGKYKSDGVPVIVIGDDQEILKGFSIEKFNDALAKVKSGKK